MTGTFVSRSGNTIVVTDGKGNDQDLNVKDGATVTRNGAASSLDDLKAGDSVSCSGNPVTSISANGS